MASLVLVWPALWNGYPLVFSDTGTYLSQAIQHYLGWDRPPFYSLFLYPLHLCITTWPAILAQALITVALLRRLASLLLPGLRAARLAALAGVLAVGSPLPFVVAQLMPDLFTGLLVLALLMLVVVPERLARWEQGVLTAFVAFAMAAHLSNLPIGAGVLAVLVAGRRRLGATLPLGQAGRLRLAAAPALAVAALMAANLAGHGRASIAPYGNVFVLARVIYDGPGMDVLRQDCPRPGWALCGALGRFPPTADGFLWRADGPVVRDGGAKRVSREADAIIHAAIAAEPRRELRAALANGLRQLVRFRTGDGLHPWPATVTPWIRRDFPHFEQRAYAASRQARGLPVVPPGLGTLHAVVALAALAGCLLLLPRALRRRDLAGGLIVAVLLTLLLNAFVTGPLSGPHDRYQSRVMWLPVLAALLAGGAELAARRGDPVAPPAHRPASGR
ncbi:MAG: hypothetical protein KGL52_01785 [Rhodospirillales bacterium]|nr:hypothetical protein [Rhodospirillales bacterium]